jgi:hypothetical protein
VHRPLLPGGHCCPLLAALALRRPRTSIPNFRRIYCASPRRGLARMAGLGLADPEAAVQSCPRHARGSEPRRRWHRVE